MTEKFEVVIQFEHIMQSDLTNLAVLAHII